MGKTPASTDLAIPSWELHVPFENLVGRPGRELFTRRVISIGGHFKPRDPRRQEKRPKDGAQGALRHFAGVSRKHTEAKETERDSELWGNENTPWE